MRLYGALEIEPTGKALMNCRMMTHFNTECLRPYEGLAYLQYVTHVEIWSPPVFLCNDQISTL